MVLYYLFCQKGIRKPQASGKGIEKPIHQFSVDSIDIKGDSRDNKEEERGSKDGARMVLDRAKHTHTHTSTCT